MLGAAFQKAEPAAVCKVAWGPWGVGRGHLELKYQTGSHIQLKVKKAGPGVGVERKG